MSILEYKETRFQVILNDHFGVCPLVRPLCCDQLCLTTFVYGGGREPGWSSWSSALGGGGGHVAQSG